MKKSSFVAMLFGTVSGMLFALGMCMALISRWNAFRPGVILGCAGVVLGLVTVLVWRKMEHKKPMVWSGRGILTAAAAVVGVLALGTGMCCTMVWGRMILGIAVGICGILFLLCLIPLTRGLHD